MYGYDSHGNAQRFEKPLFQTLMMFVAMCLAIPMHYGYQFYRRTQLSQKQLSIEDASAFLFYLTFTTVSSAK